MAKVKKKAAPKAVSKKVTKSVKPEKKPKVAKVQSKPAKKVKIAAAPKAGAKKPLVKASDKKKALEQKPKSAKAKAAKAVKGKDSEKTSVKDLASKSAAKEKVTAKTAEKSKKAKGSEEEDIDLIEELDEPFESYGEAIRLTAEDLEDPEELYLTDAEGRRYCKVKDCDQLAVVEGHCRYHYLALWKRLQIRKKILQDGKLEKYIEELTSRYPDKYIEMIRRDLKTEKDFLSAIQELEIDDTAEAEFEDDSYLEDVRGLGSGRRSGDEGGGGDEF